MASKAVMIILLLPAFIMLRIPSRVSAVCPDLAPLPLGQLLLDGVDVTLNTSDFAENQTVEYRCARGYQLVDSGSDLVVSVTTTICTANRNWTLLGVKCSTMTCTSPPVISNAQVVGTSSVYFIGLVVTYRCDPGYRIVCNESVVSSQTEATAVCSSNGEWHAIPSCVVASRGLSSFTVLVIVLAAVGSLLVVVTLTSLVCTVWACKLRRVITKGDMAEDEVAYAHSQGAFTLSNPIVTKDDESTGNPLYLTPEEMDEFESKRRQLGGTA